MSVVREGASVVVIPRQKKVAYISSLRHTSNFIISQPLKYVEIPKYTSFKMHFNMSMNKILEQCNEEVSSKIPIIIIGNRNAKRFPNFVVKRIVNVTDLSSMKRHSKYCKFGFLVSPVFKSSGELVDPSVFGDYHTVSNMDAYFKVINNMIDNFSKLAKELNKKAISFDLIPRFLGNLHINLEENYVTIKPNVKATCEILKNNVCTLKNTLGVNIKFNEEESSC